MRLAATLLVSVPLHCRAPASGRQIIHSVEVVSLLSHFCRLTWLYRGPHNATIPVDASDRRSWTACVHMTFDEELNQSFDTIAERLRAEISRQVQGAIENLSAQAHIDRERAVAEARAAVALAASEDLAAAVTAAEARQAAAAAAAEAREAVAIAAAEARAREQAPIPSFDPTGRLRDAVRAFTVARSLTDVLDLLMTRAALEVSRVAVLLVQGGRLRVWRLAGFPPKLDDDAVPGDWGSVAEAWRTNTAVMSGRSGMIAAPVFAELPEGREAVAVPIALCGDVVAVLYADQGTSDDHAEPPSPAWSDMIELLTRYATVSLEALTAFKTARALMGPQDDAASPTADDVTSDAAARRYARLLVSEIKLYHEAAVVAGRRDRDLVTRLGGEIARALVLYEQRVPPPVRQHADYFHDELVRTLANGDASLLELRT